MGFLYYFFQKSLFTENYLLIAGINLTTQGPLYTCLVLSELFKDFTARGRGISLGGKGSSDNTLSVRMNAFYRLWFSCLVLKFRKTRFFFSNFGIKKLIHLSPAGVKFMENQIKYLGNLLPLIRRSDTWFFYIKRHELKRDLNSHPPSVRANALPTWLFGSTIELGILILARPHYMSLT